ASCERHQTVEIARTWPDATGGQADAGTVGEYATRFDALFRSGEPVNLHAARRLLEGTDYSRWSPSEVGPIRERLRWLLRASMSFGIDPVGPQLGFTPPEDWFKKLAMVAIGEVGTAEDVKLLRAVHTSIKFSERGAAIEKITQRTRGLNGRGP
ncbi:MAG: hypothetical protein ACYSU0_10985, partial [Planctomycetota bacterium]